MTTMNRPAPAQPSLYRFWIESEIERLLTILDDIDGEADFEPWLGIDRAGFALDAEGDAADDEPSLGFTEEVDQEHRALTSEPLSPDGAEGDDEREPDDTDHCCEWSNDPDVPQEGPQWWGEGSSGVRIGL